ncbi:MAG: DnaA/Hda family protein [Gemmatimonadota bacterium]
MISDPRLTFDSFVIGPANRLACAAARRAADSPGASFNPLFLYSASGLGKSHILSAMAHHSQRMDPEARVVYQTLEGYLDELMKALEAGEKEVIKERYSELSMLLLDDVQFLTGQTQAQEMLLRTLDALMGSGSQIVLASDRPPAEINGLDARLLSRFSGGLIVDIAAPEYETRVAIMLKKVEERKANLEPGVAEALARFPFRNVRELQGGLNRVLAIQELEGIPIRVENIPELLAGEALSGSGDEFGSFLSEITGSVAATVEEQEAAWRRALREAAEEGEAHDFSTVRLRRLLEAAEEPENAEEVAAEFRSHMARLTEIRKAVDALGNPWPEGAQAVLKDPERLEEAEMLLASALERVRAFPALPAGPGLEEIAPSYSQLAVKASERLALAARPDYNPLFVWCSDSMRSREILEATGRAYMGANPEGKVGLISAAEFAEDFIRAISGGVAGAWRERWWTVELLLLHGVEALSTTERAQDEFFHLFEALKRQGARLLLAADRPPSAIENIDDRLRSRFEGGLVVELVPPVTTRRETVSPAPSGSAEYESFADVFGTGSGAGKSGGGASAKDAPEESSDAQAETPRSESDASGGASRGSGTAADARAADGGNPAADASGTPGGAEKAAVPGEAESAGASNTAGGAASAAGAGMSAGDAAAPGDIRANGKGGKQDLLSRERVVWEWPRLEDRLVEDFD